MSQVLFDQVRDDFGIGLSDEAVIGVTETFLKLQVIFDDSVVNDNHAARAIAMRVRVFFGWASMRGPARVADAVSAIDWAKPNRLFEVAQFAFCAADLEFVALVDDSDTGRVVAAILELSQALDDQRYDLFITYITNNSTHASECSRKGRKDASRFHTTIRLLPLRLCGNPFLYFNFFFISAGTPATSESGGTSFVTTDPAPVIDRAPTRTGATNIVSEPILTSSSIIVSCLFLPS